jgi:hypothetical protein
LRLLRLLFCSHIQMIVNSKLQILIAHFLLMISIPVFYTLNHEFLVILTSTVSVLTAFLLASEIDEFMNPKFRVHYAIPEVFITFSKYMVFFLLSVLGYVSIQYINFQYLIKTNSLGTVYTVLLKSKNSEVIIGNAIIFFSAILMSTIIPRYKYFLRLLVIALGLVLFRAIVTFILTSVSLKILMVCILITLVFWVLKKSLNVRI